MPEQTTSTSERLLRHHDDPSMYVKALRFLHDYTSQIYWSSDDLAAGELTATNAFAEEADSPRLVLLRTVAVEPPSERLAR